MSLRNKKYFIILFVTLGSIIELYSQVADDTLKDGGRYYIENSNKRANYLHYAENYNLLEYGGECLVDTSWVKDGVVVEFHEREGTVASIKYYDCGRKVGKWKYFYSSGAVKAERSYAIESNNIVCKEIQYAISIGDVYSVAGFEIGLPHGVWKEWYENNQLKSVSEYRNGFPVGEWKMFYRDGALMLKGNYFPKSQKKVSCEIKASLPGNEVFLEGLPFLLFSTKEGEWSYIQEPSGTITKIVYKEGIAIKEEIIKK